ncbi:RNA polymerase subunit sigma-24 [Paenibacillus melissococcoides]|uniref:RNA polymerase subunit sigma-24 n=1 Tax=Paenibacillus melissococcoides TaxID=2912268 RepID=A0ABM9GDP3_9BACL|nr:MULTISPECIES: RNA polymerase subunit sigma-24 [Paenibacillus]MEB9893791.1 RNA polymerase subunit sigma-24 [Bacillus cereus]CAH8249877.1 RNA polymerase subunit sigma-24 [Paenibacillus melissococcoides]CAH8718696.1 RNA polymerase subunit sigma-24 [Paenibacillus melissococcoides]CAH8719702.1 RNA polymerase subunit sigma-24 [Paenibacillus melissococcoides]
MTKQIEQRVIEQLTGYRDIVGRLRVLETYSVGNGITVSRLNEDDHLQELHRRLRGLPSYMYLTPREQRLEATAHAYLTRYPAGTRAQLQAVQECEPADEGDRQLLEELRRKIAKVIKARTGTPEGYEAILAQLSEYQDLKAEKQRIDAVLDAMKAHYPEHETLLRLHFVEGKGWGELSKVMHLSKSGFYRLRHDSLAVYARLAGWENYGTVSGKLRE